METFTEHEIAGQYLTFLIAGEEYAVDILQVREIIEHVPITPVPGMPAAVRGVINLRGSVVPVIDLASRFGIAPTPVTRWTCFVIVETRAISGQPVMGVLVDAVCQVIDLAAEDIEPPPSLGTPAPGALLRGLAHMPDHKSGDRKTGDKLVLILDLEQALAMSELIPAALPPIHRDSGKAPSEAAAAQPA